MCKPDLLPFPYKKEYSKSQLQKFFLTPLDKPFIDQDGWTGDLVLSQLACLGTSTVWVLKYADRATISSNLSPTWLKN